MRKNFICVYCGKVHDMGCSMCPETDKPLSPAHKYSLTTLEGKYSIQRIIGEGGMGVIYDGEITETGGRVAVKFLNPLAGESWAAYERFAREARAASMIKHHNIANVLDVGRNASGIPFIVMEYLDGEDLGSRITSSRSFPLEGAADVLAQVLETLDAVHSKGIVHRDLKPENVFLVKHHDLGEFVKLLDFGIARLSAYEIQGARLTAPGNMFGTSFYISPEQADGDLGTDHRTDLYAAGVIFYEMLTGRLPFFDVSPGKILMEIATFPPPDPRTFLPTLPRAASDFLFTALDKDRGSRFQSAGEMLRELKCLDLSGVERVQVPHGRIKQAAEVHEDERKTVKR